MSSSLRVQAMVILILICLLVALILGGLWLNNAQECIKSGVQLSSQQDARHIADQAGAYIGKYEAYSAATAFDRNTGDGILLNDPGKLKLAADGLQASIPKADFVQIADESGDILYSTTQTNITNLGTYTWYAEATNKTMPYVTGLYYNSVSGKDVFSILTPVLKNGSVIGRIILAFTPDVLQGSIQGIDPMKNVLIVDNGGKVVSRDKNATVEPRTNVSAYTPVRRALNGEQGVVKHTDTWDGNGRVSAYAPMSDTGWAVIVSEPTVVAYRPMQDQLFMVLGALALLIIGFSTFSFYASKQLSDPIVKLSETAKKAYAGNYDVAMDVTRNDELGDLARTFNDLRGELKIRNERLMDESDRFQVLIRDLSVGVLLIGAHGEYIGSNSALLNLLGITEDQLEGMTIFDADWALWNNIRGDGKAIPREAHPILIAYATRQPVKDVPVEVYRPIQGDTVWLKVSAEPQLTHDGTVKGMISTFVDVTECRMLEETLALAQFSQENTPEEIFWIAPDGRFYHVNDAACDALGYSRDQLLSMKLWDVDPAFSPETWPQRWKEFKEAGYASMQAMQLTGDHTAFPVDAVIRHIEFHGREYVCIFARNISELKHAEDAMLRANTDLARSQEAARLGSYVWNVATGEATWSGELYHVLGVEPGEKTPSIEEYLRIVHPDDRKTVDDAIKGALSGGRIFSIDHRVVSRDGSVRYVHSAGEAMLDSSGNATHVYGTIQDINARKLVEIERDDLRLKLSSERARLEAVLRNIPAGIVIAEAPSGRVIMVNRQMEQIFRHTFPFSSGIDEYGEWGVF
ncbi:MAG TPA: PAS domain S-box protein, partial [Methanocellaceae archaeon]